MTYLLLLIIGVFSKRPISGVRMENQVFVLGGEQSDFERNFSKEGKTFLSLLRETLEDSLIATSLDYDIFHKVARDNRIALFFGNFDGEQYLNQGHFGAVLTEISPVFYGIPSARYEAACASSSVAIDAAATKIRAGEIDLAIVVGIEMMKTVSSKQCGDFLGTAAYYKKEALGLDYPFPKLFGQLADEYLRRYDIGEKRYMDCLASIACKNYANAKSNPKAQTRKWFMSQDQARSRGTETNPQIGGKLAVSDCSQVTDGAVVLFLASEKFTRKYAMKRNISISDIPRITGWGCRVAPMQFSSKMKESENQRIRDSSFLGLDKLYLMLTSEQVST